MSKRVEKVFAEGFKGFDWDLKCRDMQYEENSTFEVAEAEICRKGMHFCIKPLDVLHYYAVADDAGEARLFAPVQALAKPVKDRNVCITKRATTKLHVGRAYTFKEFMQESAKYYITAQEKPGIRNAAVDNKPAVGYHYCHINRMNGVQQIVDKATVLCERQNNTIYTLLSFARVTLCESFNTVVTRGIESDVLVYSMHNNIVSRGRGDRIRVLGPGNIVASYASYVTVDIHGHDNQVLSTGDYPTICCDGVGNSVRCTGDVATVVGLTSNARIRTSGNASSVLLHGNFHMATLQNKNNVGVASGELNKLRTEGDNNVLVSCGDGNTLEALYGENNLLIAAGDRDAARGPIGTWIVLTEWKNGVIQDVKAFKVDGVNLLPTVFYIMEKGKPVAWKQTESKV